MVHRTPREHFNSSTAYTLQMTDLVLYNTHDLMHSHITLYSLLLTRTGHHTLNTTHMVINRNKTL